MKIATWNVNGIRAREAQFLEWLGANAPDVFCLQEIKASLGQLPFTVTQLPDYFSYWHGGEGGYSGVAILLKKSTFLTEPTWEHPPFDMEHRVVMARLTSDTRADLGAVIPAGSLLSSMYLPNGGKDFDAKIRFVTAMIGWVKTQREGGTPLMIAGDLNIARRDIDVHPSQRKTDAIGQLAYERLLFDKVLSAGLVDTHRVVDPTGDRVFSWWPYWNNARKNNVGWRIDYVLASPGFAGQPVGAQVQREFGASDHAPVIITFGPGGGS